MKKCIFFPNFGLASAMLTYFLKHIFKNSSKPATETILTNGARFTQECANSCQNKLLEAYLPTQMAFSAFRHRCRRTDGRRKLAQIGTDMHVEKFSKCDR